MNVQATEMDTTTTNETPWLKVKDDLILPIFNYQRLPLFHVFVCFFSLRGRLKKFLIINSQQKNLGVGRWFGQQISFAVLTPFSLRLKENNIQNMISIFQPPPSFFFFSFFFVIFSNQPTFFLLFSSNSRPNSRFFNVKEPNELSS